MRNPWTPETQNRIREYTISGVIIAIACFALMHVQEIINFLLLIWKALAPFIWGFCIAFILSPLSRMCEERWIVNWKVSPKLKRVISVAVALILFVLIITLFFVILIPQLINSFNSLISSMDGYISTLEQFLQRFGQYQELDDILISVYEMVKENLVGWVSGSNGIVTKVLSYSVNVVRGVLNFFIGIIIAIYLLLDKERWKKQFKKLTYSVMSVEHAENFFHVLRLTGKMLDSFIFGKALDSLIIGIATAVCCALMKIPYVPLIAFIVGITNMIPVFGPFIGAVPCAFILLIISPAKALEFIIFILVLQQIDGNILGPYILGDSMGLPPVWIMFAIIVGGAIWGVLGMFLGVPIFSVFYILIKDQVTRKLKEKRIRVD